MIRLIIVVLDKVKNIVAREPKQDLRERRMTVDERRSFIPGQWPEVSEGV